MKYVYVVVIIFISQNYQNNVDYVQIVYPIINAFMYVICIGFHEYFGVILEDYCAWLCDFIPLFCFTLEFGVVDGIL